jgi:hypothetical protein
MAFPKHNIHIMFIELSCTSLNNVSPLLYLPIKKTKKYFKHFPGCTRKRHLYVRTSCFSKPLRDLLQPIFDKMQTFNFVFLNADQGSEDFLKDIDFDLLRELIFKCSNRQLVSRWIRVVRKSKTDWSESHPVFGKYLLFCSFILSHAFSEQCLKRQFRLNFSSSDHVR